MTRIALVGYGQMGRCIDSISDDVVTRIDPYAEGADHRKISAAALEGVDVCIEFSRPDAVVANLEQLLTLGIPVVVGTTGWEAQREVIRKQVEQSGSALLYGENFSLGVQAFVALVRQAAERFSAVGGYGIGGVEVHHERKLDRPSGTARVLEKAAASGGFNLEFSSIRCGEVYGTHTVLFSSAGDTVTMTHQAHTREGFARGAVAAADWLIGKTGMYHITEMLEEVSCVAL